MNESMSSPKTTLEIIEVIHDGGSLTLEEVRLAALAMSYTLSLTLHKVKFMKDHPWPEKLKSEAKDVYNMYEKTMGLPPDVFLDNMAPGKPGHTAWRQKVREQRERVIAEKNAAQSESASPETEAQKRNGRIIKLGGGKGHGSAKTKIRSKKRKPPRS